MRPDTRAAIRTGVRLALAHHPLCGYFAHDTLPAGPLRVCSGCAAAAPAFLLALAPALAAARAWGALPALALGLALGLPHLAGYLRRRGRVARFAAKAVGGAGLALVMAAILLAPWALVAKASLLALMALAFVALQLARMRQMLRTCRACPWAARWAQCPGFAAASN